MSIRNLKNSLKKRLQKNKFLVYVAKKRAMNGKILSTSPSRDELHQLFKKPPEESFENEKDAVARSEYLYEKIRSLPGVRKDDSILEIGCSMGRNLNWLYTHGFQHLSGIEINSKAISLMKKYYPEMHTASAIMEGPVEEEISKIGKNQTCITFTMAVLYVIHPTSNFVFEEISRITSDYIITLERENLYNPVKEFPRDYKKIFEDLGWKQTDEELVDKSIIGSEGYILRIFQRKFS